MGGKQCVDKDIGGLKTVVCSKVCFVSIFLKRTLKTANIDLLFSFLFYMLVALYSCTLCKKNSEQSGFDRHLVKQYKMCY